MRPGQYQRMCGEGVSGLRCTAVVEEEQELLFCVWGPSRACPEEGAAGGKCHLLMELSMRGRKTSVYY